jgi:hypothetical protein
MGVFILISIFATQMSMDSFGQNMGCDSVYIMIEEAPMFKSGYDELAFYIDNLNFGDCGRNKSTILIWTINRSGKMIDIDVEGLEGECKSRIIAQLDKYPLWTPARVMGMPVCFQMKVKRPPK